MLNAPQKVVDSIDCTSTNFTKPAGLGYASRLASPAVNAAHMFRPKTI
jgi:hypothetical protein